jgi:hypothetical protein
MEPHEHTMTSAVDAHEYNLSVLFRAAAGDADDAFGLDMLGVDVDNAEDSAREALDAYDLEASTSTILTVTLAVGGPTQTMSAKVVKEQYGWQRDSRVTFSDSWAVPSETELPDESPLVQLFDERVETISD